MEGGTFPRQRELSRDVVPVLTFRQLRPCRLHLLCGIQIRKGTEQV